MTTPKHSVRYPLERPVFLCNRPQAQISSPKTCSTGAYVGRISDSTAQWRLVNGRRRRGARADICGRHDTSTWHGSTGISHQVREQESRVNRPESLGALPLLHHARNVTLAAPLPGTQPVNRGFERRRHAGKNMAWIISTANETLSKAAEGNRGQAARSKQRVITSKQHVPVQDLRVLPT